MDVIDDRICAIFDSMLNGFNVKTPDMTTRRTWQSFISFIPSPCVLYTSPDTSVSTSLLDLVMHEWIYKYDSGIRLWSGIIVVATHMLIKWSPYSWVIYTVTIEVEIVRLVFEKCQSWWNVGSFYSNGCYRNCKKN